MSRMLQALLVLALVASPALSSQPRLLRRGHKNLGNRNTGVCLENPNLYMTQAGERTAESMMGFLNPSPNLPVHREKFGYTDASVAAFYHGAALHFFNLYGVDFTRAETDPVTGERHVGNFMLKPVTVDFGLRVPYTSVHGHFGCPIEVFDEGVLFMVTGDDTYYGSFGGPDGKPALAGDFVPYGHYAIDFNGDGDYTMIRYQADGPPVRTGTGGNHHISCDVFSMRWGWGRNEGKFYYVHDDEGRPHVSSRAVMSFPSRFQLAAREGFP